MLSALEKTKRGMQVAVSSGSMLAVSRVKLATARVCSSVARWRRTGMGSWLGTEEAVVMRLGPAGSWRVARWFAARARIWLMR